MPNGDFDETLKSLQAIQDQIAKTVLAHSEMLAKHEEMQAAHERLLATHTEFLAEHERLMAQHDIMVAQHERRMAEHDERMDRVGRHLEVLANISDDLIRNKADRKKR